jgi:hypothetical protein
VIDELVLHIGPPKTATTTVQAALAESAVSLLDEGVFVPQATGYHPAQHLPILREVVDEAYFNANFDYSHSVLSLAAVIDTIRRLQPRIVVISAEEFCIAPCREGVMEVIRRLEPRLLHVTYAIRSLVPWLTSSHAQHVTYGLSAASLLALEDFAPWLEAMPYAMDESISTWSKGSWETEVTAMVLGAGSDPVQLFAAATGIHDLRSSGSVLNERLDACSIRALQAMNLVRGKRASSMESAWMSRLPVVDSLRRHGVPAHTCDCRHALSASEAGALVAPLRAGYERLLSQTTSVVGGGVESLMTFESDASVVVPRFPDQTSVELALRVVERVVGEMAYARDADREQLAAATAELRETGSSDALRSRIREMEASRSWRLTEPLRKVVGAVRRARGRGL